MLLPGPEAQQLATYIGWLLHRTWGGMMGYLGGQFAPQAFRVGGGHGGQQRSYGPAVIDDHTPWPQHTHFRWLRLMLLLAIGLVLWLLPLTAIAAAVVVGVVVNLARFFG